MQLKDIIEQFSSLEAADQIEKIRKIRLNRNVVRPAAAARQRAAGKKSKPKAVSLLSGLSKAQIKQLLEEAGEE